MLATAISFFVPPTKNYRLLFWCAAPFSLQAVFTSFFGVLPEEWTKSNALNTELLKEHRSMFVMGGFMGFVCLLLMVTQLATEDMYVELGVTAACAVVLSIGMFFFMPLRLAKATLFLFLTNTTSVSFGSAM